MPTTPTKTTAATTGAPTPPKPPSKPPAPPNTTTLEALVEAEPGPLAVAEAEPGPGPLVLVDPRGVAPRAKRTLIPRPIRRLGGPLALLAVWQLLCTTGVLDPQLMAPPGDVLRAAGDLWSSGELQEHLAVSLGRVAQGLAIGVAVGVLLATVSGLFRLGDDLLDSTLQVIRAIPPLGLIGLVIVWFGIGEQPKIFLVAYATTFPVYLNTYAGIRGVDNKLVEAGRTFGLRRLGLVRRVILPGAVPGFLVGLRFALTVAWLVMIVAEQIDATSGLGYLINSSRSWGRLDILVLGLVLYGALGFVADALVRLLERTLLVWRRGFAGT